MRQGYVTISNREICDAFQFPADWVIEEIKPGESIQTSVFRISGSDFPETNNRGAAEDVQVIVHKQEVRHEVNRLE